MTVSQLVTRNDITSTSGQTSFTYTFRVLDRDWETLYILPIILFNCLKIL